MKISKSVKFLSLALCLTFILMCASFFVGYSKKSVADTSVDSSSSIDIVEDEKFSVQAEASGRRNVTIFNEKRTVTTVTNETVDYYCFNWRDISHLSFTFSSHILQDPENYTHYNFVVSSLKTENLETSPGLLQETTLFDGDIISNIVSIPRYYFYIDSDVEISESAQDRSKGIGFGLYKFQFGYTISQTINDEEEYFPFTLDPIYIAVLPDKIDTISAEDMTIRYSVKSSNRLMNVYDLYLSKAEDFKYVNPNFIKWSVVGKDKNKADYVLTQEIKDSDSAYANHRVIWTSQMPTEPLGTSFLFDSNDIEGTWTVFCTIYNTDGTQRETISIENLATIKAPSKSYLALVLGIVLSVAIVGGIVGLVVYANKKRKSM